MGAGPDQNQLWFLVLLPAEGQDWRLVSQMGRCRVVCNSDRGSRRDEGRGAGQGHCHCQVRQRLADTAVLRIHSFLHTPVSITRMQS